MVITEHDERSILESVHVRMSRYGQVLTGREAGAAARFDIERESAQLTPGQPVALDFSDVQAVTVPFAEECLGGLLNGYPGHHESHPIVAIGASDDVGETIAAALRPRRQALLSLSSRGAQLLGGDGFLNRTMQEARRLGEFTAADWPAVFTFRPKLRIIG